MLALLRLFSWPEWRQRPLRHATALLAVALGVALAYAVQLVNGSALAEFSGAVRAANGQADVELRGPRGGFDEDWYPRIVRHAGTQSASPVVEVDSYALDARGERMPLRIVGQDAFVAGRLGPASLPRPRESGAGDAIVDPDAVYLNAAARQRLGSAEFVRVQSADRLIALRDAGDVALGGGPTAVMDIAGAQARFGMLGRLSRIDVRLVPGTDRDTWLRGLALPPELRADGAEQQASRVSNLSRAYRVNLTVLALVALFTGGFLVFSVLALSVAQRQPQFALLGVLGLAARDRRRLVLAEAALLGGVGSACGLALGAGLAYAALRWLSGDLGGGYFPGVTPRLVWQPSEALAFGALGAIAAMAGAWLPARQAERLVPAQALKGLGQTEARLRRPWLGPALLVASAALAFAPPIAELPIAAYLSVAGLLFGGIACLPAGIALLLRSVRPPRQALALLAVERARDQRQQATLAVAGVVASLSLAVALTVMVTSFRASVAQWLDTLLPADLYVRTAGTAQAADFAFLPPALIDAMQRLPGVVGVEPQRIVSMTLAGDRPPVTLIARPIDDPATRLPLVGALAPAAAGMVPVYVSEAMRTLYGAEPGSRLQLPLPGGGRVDAQVRAVWRDYARQHGAVAIDLADYRRLSGDVRTSDVAIRLAPGADAGAVQQAIRAAAPEPALIDFATAGEIRAISLRIFDRSFAVTYWLQAIAIGIGLFGIAASFSAQILARRREFGLLVHLGLTRREVMTVIAGEGLVWTVGGALLGLVLGLAVSVVLVKVVNPQSFHWTMELHLPALRLAALCGAVVAAGTLTAWFAGRHAAGRDLARAVKEDW